MEKYSVIDKIGEGSFGRVYKVRSKVDEQIVALKLITKCGRSRRELANLRKECEIQRHLFHPNIIKMLDSFETSNEIAVVTEFAYQDLYKTLARVSFLSEEDASKIICDLISALYYLHSNRVIHRDLKPQNVLLSEDGTAKLCDFGFARSMSTGTHVLTSIKGTPLYMAPELIEECPYDHNVDLWSLGCIAYEMLVGSPPFNTTSLLHLISLIRKESIIWPENVSHNCQSLLKGLLNKDPTQRLTWPHLLEHPFVKGNILIINDKGVSTPLTAELTISQEMAKAMQKQDLTLLKAAAQLHRHHDRYGRYLMLNPEYVRKHFPRELPARDDSNITSKIKSAEKNLEKMTLNCKKEISDKGKDASVISSKVKVLDKKVDKNTSNPTKDAMPNDKLKEISYTSPKLKVEEKLEKAALNVRNEYIPNQLDKFKLEQELKEAINYDEDKVASSIEAEEWLAFIQQSMEEIMAGDVTTMKDGAFLNMICRALSSIHPNVIEYIASLFCLPFVVKELDETELTKIRQVYYNVKIVPKLLLSTSILLKRTDPEHSLNDDNLQALESVCLLITNLVYSDNMFLQQFCFVSVTLSLTSHFTSLFTLKKRKVKLVTNLICVLCQILRQLPEYAYFVDNILKGLENAADEFYSMLTFKNEVMTLRTLGLLQQMAKHCIETFKNIWCESLEERTLLFTRSSNENYKKMAEEALDEIMKIPDLNTFSALLT